ncbi:carboxypeptidase regulatory-like domain-containing protein [Achromobacter seleniivolatilans]|uniref:Carboxypeptidase regulatory-like domain-containing protein n=1 Tax=Achromobacter seleniivolatilans TaxID=3047478 RepID=A0ABY9M556_9BURK|nr:carboxypeptidase regulatory-like domain-containing protein [Achromobacter sp. R39]WMD21753.1 carboxypeptidase regulatory-like domain-containing protein [Achromobacter sp. R39]
MRHYFQDHPIIRLSLPLRLLTLASTAALAGLAAGCVPYPVYKTLQPSARVTVLDTESQPIPNARVVLISSAYPYGQERSRQEMQSAQNGVATFPSQSEWRIEALMIHGSEQFFWNWCIEKAGFETYKTLNRTASQFDDKLIVELRAGESLSCNTDRTP